MTIMIEPGDREPVKVTRRTKYYSIPVYFARPDNDEIDWKYMQAFKKLDPTFKEHFTKETFFAVHIPMLNTKRLAGVVELMEEDKQYYGDDFYIVPDGWFLNKNNTFLGIPFFLRKEDCRIVEDVEGETGLAPEYIHKKVAQSKAWHRDQKMWDVWRRDRAHRK